MDSYRKPSVDARWQKADSELALKLPAELTVGRDGLPPLSGQDMIVSRVHVRT